MNVVFGFWLEGPALRPVVLWVLQESDDMMQEDDMHDIGTNLGQVEMMA